MNMEIKTENEDTDDDRVKAHGILAYEHSYKILSNTFRQSLLLEFCGWGLLHTWCFLYCVSQPSVSNIVSGLLTMHVWMCVCVYVCVCICCVSVFGWFQFRVMSVSTGKHQHLIMNIETDAKMQQTCGFIHKRNRKFRSLYVTRTHF